MYHHVKPTHLIQESWGAEVYELLRRRDRVNHGAVTKILSIVRAAAHAAGTTGGAEAVLATSGGPGD